MDKDLLKKVQSKELEILNEIIKICENHNLRYYAIGGTCLGAVRHQGFIPWDDDIDIAMPDCDYEKFRLYAQNELPPHLKISDGSDNQYYGLMFMKVHNTKTTFVEKNSESYPEGYRGIFVDIMPFYGVPDPGLKRWWFIKKVKFYLRANWKRRFPFKESKKLMSKFLWVLLSPAKILVKYDFFYKKDIKFLKKRKFDSSNYTGFTWWDRGIKRLILDKSYFDDYILMNFENIQIRCPIGWEKYLTQHFGDYTSLPPENERNSGHELAIVDIDNPYTYYQKCKQGKNIC